LLEALREIDVKHRRQPLDSNGRISAVPQQPQWTPQQVYAPREAIYRRKKTLPLRESEGMIAAAAIVPYPPGIPLMIPGERIAPGMAAYLLAMLDRGMEVLGILTEIEPLVEVLIED